MKRYFPILFILAIWFIFAHPYFFKDKIPYPSTYQVNNFSPWSSYEKFWGPVKNGAMPDIITQIYPWRHFTIESWKNGHVPLWNPYSFSGTPHLANYQSAVFSPLNILFFIFPFVDAWSILVLLQPLLSGIFMYLFIRSLKVSFVGSLIVSVSFMFCGFMTTWMGYATLGYAILFLPLALFAIEKFYETGQLGYLGILGVSIPLSFFSGHFQTSLYFFALIIGYIFYKFLLVKNVKPAIYCLLSTLCGFLIAMPQILTSVEFYSQSVRSEVFQKGEVIPWSYLPTLLAPDFFGNPVTRNDWLGHYAEWNPYIGILPFLFAFYLLIRKRIRAVFFFFISALLALFLAFDTPLLDLFIRMHIPVLSTSAASRIIVIFSFSMTVLAGFGFDQLIEDCKKRETKKIVRWFIFCLILFSILWLTVLFRLFMPVDKINIAKSNLILPTILFAAGSMVILISFFYKKLTLVTMYFLLLIIAFDMIRFSTKWMPFDPKDNAFPNVSVTDFFSKISGYDRTLGNYEAGIATYYHLPSLEGYDPLYINRYGEFIESLTDGRVKPSYRSVVNFPRNGLYTLNATSLLGIKYIMHKTSDNYVSWTFPIWDNPGQFKKLFEDGKYQAFENSKVFPRAFLVGNYKVIHKKQEIIDTMFGRDFDLQKQVVLEKDPRIKQSDLKLGQTRIIEYESNTVTIETKSDQNAILVLTDNFYPGWKGFIDSSETSVYRADYSFRAVVIPKGEHKVKFIYDPLSIRIGWYLAGIGLLSAIVFVLVKRFNWI